MGLSVFVDCMACPIVVSALVRRNPNQTWISLRFLVALIQSVGSGDKFSGDKCSGDKVIR